MKTYKVTEFAKHIGVSATTLRRWDARGRLVARRTLSNQRYYTEKDVRRVLNVKEPDRRTVVYCRVSSNSQKDDLNSQINAMEQFCLASGVPVDEWIKEVGGGMNFKRKKFLALMDDIESGNISRLYIAHKDRLVRFGFDYFEHMAKLHGCEMVVVNHESLSPQQEMVEDLMAIIHTFSCRLYGLRKYKKKIRVAVTTENSQ